jgi:co-chaperonin GroES (HSP10)
MNIIPCGHRLVIKPVKLEEHDQFYASAKRAGIQLLEVDERKQQINIDRGVVVAIGPTAFKDFGGDAWCGLQDHVGFAKFGGKYIKDPTTQEDFLILNDEDVICVFKQENV